jgi:hypothetical protein
MFLQALVPQAESVALPIEYLDHVLPPVAERERNNSHPRSKRGR